MPYVRCPRCGATHYSVGRYTTRDSCPRCFEPLDPGERELLSLRRDLKPEADSAALARQALLETFSPRLTEDAIARTALVATELVTNSVKHGGNHDRAIELFAAARSELIRIEVTDGGHGFEPLVREVHPQRESGWGLFIVDQLADRWGVETGHSFRVWAELAMDPSTFL